MMLSVSPLYICGFISAGMPFFMLYNYGAAILRAVGDTKRPLLFLIVSGVVNACLNLFLVIAFHLGVAGVAIATVTAQGISCALVLALFAYGHRQVISLRFRDLKIRRAAMCSRFSR